LYIFSAMFTVFTRLIYWNLIWVILALIVVCFQHLAILRTKAWMTVWFYGIQCVHVLDFFWYWV
jgi:hypothetical protein